MAPRRPPRRGRRPWPWGLAATAVAWVGSAQLAAAVLAGVPSAPVPDAGPEPESPGLARVYTGRVLDASHVPLAAFRIGEVEVEAERGRFALPLVAHAGHVRFTVEAPGHAQATLVFPAETSELGDILLGPDIPVRGTVREQDGWPAEGARVVCEGCRGEAAGERRLSALTDGEGRFRLGITSPSGVRFRLLAEKDGRVGWAEAGRVGEEAQLTLAPLSTVRGRVVQPRGAPVAGVAVVFVEPLLAPLRLVTGTDGTFSGEVPPGLYQVKLEPDASRPGRTWVVQVPAERSLELVTGQVGAGAPSP